MHSFTVAISRITFQCPSKDGFEDASTDSTNEEAPLQPIVDSEGDFEVRRRPKWRLRDQTSNNYVLTIGKSSKIVT